MSTNNPTDELRTEMEKLGAREFETVALLGDPVRGLAALAYAYAKAAANPIPYAIKVYENPDWHPAGEARGVATNQSVDVICQACDGDRFMPVTSGHELYGETYTPCARCNAKADTTRWVGNERRVTVPR